jgi:hypothetical protein
MTLNEVKTILTTTESTDWAKSFEGAIARSFYSDEVSVSSGGDSSRPDIQTHTDIAAYRNDSSLTIAWGLKHLDHFQMPYLYCIPGSKASGHFADTFYDKALILRIPYIDVRFINNGRVYLPMTTSTENTKPQISRGYERFVRLLNDLVGLRHYDSALGRACFVLLDKPWET